MILLDSFLGGIGILILVILGIIGIRLVVGLFLQGTADLTGKTFVHRRSGQVLASPQKRLEDEQVNPVKLKELDNVIRSHKAAAEIQFASDYKKLKAEIDGVNSKTQLNYEQSTKLISSKINQKNHDKERSELIETLIECGLPKKIAMMKAVEKFPLQ
jgi:hypothetical protein